MPIYRNNPLLYSNRVTRDLAGLRTQKWQDLVTQISELRDTDVDALAFQLTMIELCGCLRCRPGSYRLSLGCNTYASRTVANYSGSDASLMRRFKRAQEEVRAFLSAHEETDDR